MSNGAILDDLGAPFSRSNQGTICFPVKIYNP